MPSFPPWPDDDGLPHDGLELDPDDAHHNGHLDLMREAIAGTDGAAGE